MVIVNQMFDIPDWLNANSTFPADKREERNGERIEMEELRDTPGQRW